MRRTLSLALVALVVGSALAGVVAIGTLGGGTAPVGVAAADDGNVTNVSVNKTMAVDNDTESVYVEAHNTNGTNLTINIYAQNDTHEKQVVQNATLKASNDSTQLYEYTSIDAANYSDYRVTVDGEAEEVNVGLIQKVAGTGGGALLDSAESLLPDGVTLPMVAAGGAATLLIFANRRE